MGVYSSFRFFSLFLFFASTRLSLVSLFFPFSPAHLFPSSFSLRKTTKTDSHSVWISGTLQTGLYLDFFYYYLRAWRNNEKLSLPS